MSDAGSDTQFITFRLKDSLPAQLLAEWKEQIKDMPTSARRQELSDRIEDHLDNGYGSQILRNPVAARIVQDSITFGHPARYELHAWVIMPTHVHCLLTQCEDWLIGKIVKSLNGYSSREIGKKLNMPGQLWQEEPFDVLIRDADHFQRTWSYIEWNPVKAKLCAESKVVAL